MTFRSARLTGLALLVAVVPLSGCGVFGPDEGAAKDVVEALEGHDHVASVSFEQYGDPFFQGYSTNLTVEATADSDAEAIADVLNDVRDASEDAGLDFKLTLSREDATTASIVEEIRKWSDPDFDLLAERLATVIETGLSDKGDVLVGEDTIDVEVADREAMSETVDLIASSATYQSWERWRLTVEDPHIAFNVLGVPLTREVAGQWHSYVEATTFAPDLSIWTTQFDVRSDGEWSGLDVTFAGKSDVPSVRFDYASHGAELLPSIQRLVDLAEAADLDGLTIGRYAPAADDGGVDLVKVAGGRVTYGDLGWGPPVADYLAKDSPP